MGLWQWLEKRFPPEPEPDGQNPLQQPPAKPSNRSGSTEPQLGTRLEPTLAQLKTDLAGSEDITFREIEIGGRSKAALVFVDGLVDVERLEQGALVSLIGGWIQSGKDGAGTASALSQHLLKSNLLAAKVSEATTYTALMDEILSGQVALLVDGVAGGLSLGIQSWERRTPDEPKTETVIRGPRESFTEYVRTNTALLRRRIRTKTFKLEAVTIGKLTRSDVVLAYISDVASPSLIREVRRRLDRIQIDGVIESGYLEEYLEDQPLSPFSQVQNTERPDVAVAALLEGRAAILTDGTPFVLIVPATFFQLMQSAEDHYERFWIGSALRLLRYVMLATALVLPSLYVAITTFHPEMIPTPLLLTISAAREGIPFPAVVEALTMELAFEVLREAGVRLPQPAGQAVSIVGALVIGQAAVQAGIVSAPMVIVVAMTGIASFVAPRYNAAMSLRLLRFPLILLGSALGLFGVVSGVLAIAIHLCSLKSFGMPYLTPAAPIALADWKDFFVRLPRWALRSRPSGLASKNRTRAASGRQMEPTGGSAR